MNTEKETIQRNDWWDSSGYSNYREMNGITFVHLVVPLPIFIAQPCFPSFRINDFTPRFWLLPVFVRLLRKWLDVENRRDRSIIQDENARFGRTYFMSIRNEKTPVSVVTRNFPNFRFIVARHQSSERNFFPVVVSRAATGCCFVCCCYCCCVGLAQFSRPEYGLSGIRGGILGTGRLQHRQILSVGRVSTKLRAEARHGGKKQSPNERKIRDQYINVGKNSTEIQCPIQLNIPNVLNVLNY